MGVMLVGGAVGALLTACGKVALGQLILVRALISSNVGGLEDREW